MSKDLKRIFAKFGKVEEQADGTLKVSGIASTETEDSDGEVVTADAMRAALPDYMTFGAVREMHQPIAAGTAIEANVNDDGVTEFSAHIVDAGSVKKVQTGVLKGFSIGGKITKRAADSKNKITGLKLVEISLVDRPANPDCKVLVVKFDKDGRALAGADGLKKGMYDVSRLADLLCSLHYLTQSVQAEAVYEGDSSAIGAKLHAQCESLVGILKELLDEETAEMLGLTGANIAAAAKAAESHASGARHSLEVIRTEISELRKAASAAPTNGARPMNDLEKAEFEKAKNDLKTAQEKLATSESEKAAAVTAQKAAESARDTAVTAQKAAETQRDEIAKESAKLVESLTAKGHLKTVKKGDEGGSTVSADEKAKQEKDPLFLVKQSHAKPITVVPGTPAAS